MGHIKYHVSLWDYITYKYHLKTQIKTSQLYLWKFSECCCYVVFLSTLSQIQC